MSRKNEGEKPLDHKVTEHTPAPETPSLETFSGTRRRLLQAGWTIPVVLALMPISVKKVQAGSPPPTSFIRFTEPTFVRGGE